MQIEIWSDIACPFCYIGRRRLENAIEQFEHNDDVEIIWRSFQLDPTAPREATGTSIDYLMEKKGIDRAQLVAIHDRLAQQAADLGLTFNFESTHPDNSLDAHRLLHLAAHHGLQGEMKERLQKAYFTDGLSIGNRDTLVQLGVEVGLDVDEVRAVIEGDAYTVDVHADIRKAQMLGVNGVPFFVFDNRYAISGAQPTELFLETLERTWHDAHPLVTVTQTDANADVCTDESCAI